MSPFYQRLPLNPEPAPLQSLINFFYLVLFVLVMVFQGIIYVEVIELRKTVHSMQLHESR